MGHEIRCCKPLQGLNLLMRNGCFNLSSCFIALNPTRLKGSGLTRYRIPRRAAPLRAMKIQ